MNTPATWITAEIGEIFEIIRGISFPKEERRNHSGKKLVACLRTANVQKEVDWEDLWFVPLSYVKRKEQYIKLNDILISTANSLELVGKVALVRNLPYESTLGAFISLIRVPVVVSPLFVYYRLSAQDIRELIRNVASTTTNISNISTGKLSKISVTLAPLNEQKRIVAKIESLFSKLDAAEEALKRAQANLKRYKASVLKVACEGRLVPTEADLASKEGRDYEPASALLGRILAERRAKWEAEEWEKLVTNAKKKVAQQQRRQAGLPPRTSDLTEEEWQNLPEDEYRSFLPKDQRWKEKYEEPSLPNVEELPDLPEGWAWATVEQIGDQRLGKMLDKSKNQGVLRPYLRNLNVRWFTFNLSDIKEMRVTNEELVKVSVEKGDVLICEGGEPGRSAVWNKDQAFVFQKALHRVRLNHVDSWYFVYLLAGMAGSGQLEEHFTGSTIKHFTGESLVGMPVPLPPENEQRRISKAVDEKLSLINHSLDEVEIEIRKVNLVRQSILKKAFEGKLVPQDPADEPASELLERISRGG
jgi:type I restriction enzyme, S subunit